MSHFPESTSRHLVVVTHIIIYNCILTRTSVIHVSTPWFEDGHQVFEVSAVHGWLVPPSAPHLLYSNVMSFPPFRFTSCSFRSFLIVMSNVGSVSCSLLSLVLVSSWVQCMTDVREVLAWWCVSNSYSHVNLYPPPPPCKSKWSGGIRARTREGCSRITFIYKAYSNILITVQVPLGLLFDFLRFEQAVLTCRGGI